ncbi:MAG: tetratricopeptide repeat protein, partial [Flavobacteriaceae bacterium]|nr:tetratricopeptide repeat protein [Flavobacteriaceae bacterium]
GNYYLKDDKLLFQCSITDGDYDKTLISFDPVSCDRQNPLECVEALKQVILGFLITEVNPELNLQETPPRFEAYEYFINAKANIANDQVYLDLLNKAIEADSTYFEAKVDRALYYYNAREFRIADSLIGRIVPNSINSTRQINLLNQNKALLNGNNKKAYTYIQQEYNYAPFHLETNSGAMVVTLQYVNKPEKIDSLFNFIPMEKMNLETCTFCKFRYYIQGLALNELKQYNKTQQLLAPVIEQSEDYYLKIPLIAALVRSGNFAKLDDLLNRIHLTADGATLSAASLFAGKECLLKGDTEKASLYFDKVLANESLEIPTVEMASAYYYKKDFDTAVSILEKLLTDDPENHSLLSKLAVSYAKIGNQEKSDDTLRRLEKSRSDYQYGSVDYAYAQFFAATGNKDKALQHLLLSIANGNSYTPNTYQNDPHFKAYHDNQAFKNILTFWH